MKSWGLRWHARLQYAGATDEMLDMALRAFGSIGVTAVGLVSSSHLGFRRAIYSGQRRIPLMIPKYGR